MNICGRLLLSHIWRGLERENQFLKNSSFLDNLAGLLFCSNIWIDAWTDAGIHLGFTIFAERTVPPIWEIYRTVERAAPDRALLFRASMRWNLLARQFVFCSSSRGTGPFYVGLIFLETGVQAHRISSDFIRIGGWCPFLWTSKDSFSWSGFRENWCLGDRL